AAGLVAAGARAGTPVDPPTVATATARPNIPYAPDADGGADDQGRGSGGRGTDDDYDDEADDDRGGGGPWVWISGLLGLPILALVAFLLVRFLSGAPSPAAVGQVQVPNF